MRKKLCRYFGMKAVRHANAVAVNKHSVQITAACLGKYPCHGQGSLLWQGKLAISKKSNPQTDRVAGAAKLP